MSGQELRLGIVGTGLMAGQMAQAARSVGGVSVSCVLSRDAERASQFCNAHAPGAVATSETSELFHTVDAVYVATPPQTHAAFIELAIRSGKAILCEKPLSLSSADTIRLLKLAREARVPVMEAIWTLALPAYRMLHETFRDRQNAVLHFDFSYPVSVSGQSHILDPVTGGVLVDRSVYGYAAAISLLGDVTRQSVWVTRNETGLETDAELRLEHADGARSLITLSIEKVGPNLLQISNNSGLTTLGPTSLAAETLGHVAPPDTSRPSGPQGKPTLKSRLKTSPRLRALKARLPARNQFMSYGESSYAPILEEFISVLEQGLLESEVVPHRLSEQIALLTEDARHGSTEPQT